MVHVKQYISKTQEKPQSGDTRDQFQYHHVRIHAKNETKASRIANSMEDKIEEDTKTIDTVIQNKKLKYNRKIDKRFDFL